MWACHVDPQELTYQELSRSNGYEVSQVTLVLVQPCHSENFGTSLYFHVPDIRVLLRIQGLVGIDIEIHNYNRQCEFWIGGSRAPLVP